MPARYALEALDSLELALEWPLIFECVPPHDFGGSEDTGGLATRKPNFAIRAAANASQQFVIGYDLTDVQSGTGIEHCPATVAADIVNSRTIGIYESWSEFHHARRSTSILWRSPRKTQGIRDISLAINGKSSHCDRVCAEKRS